MCVEAGASVVCQILVCGFAAGQHGDQCDRRCNDQIPGRSQLVARDADQPGGDERSRAAKQGIGRVEAEGKAAVAHLGREDFRQEAGQCTVVH